MERKSLHVWIEGTLMASLAMLLSFIPTPALPFGFNLSLGLLPLVLYSLRRGWQSGMVAGFVWGLLCIVLGDAAKYYISVPQIIFEYPFAFAFSGLGGIFSQKIQLALKKQQKKRVMLYLISGSTLAIFARYFWHFWAGVAVWGAYAPKGMSPYLYSFLVNGSSCLVNVVYVSAVLLVLIKAAPNLFLPKK